MAAIAKDAAQVATSARQPAARAPFRFGGGRERRRARARAPRRSPRRSEIAQPLPARGCRGALEVGRDFQPLGFGLAATDVAHHVVGSIAADALAARTAALLDHYHSALCQDRACVGAAADADDAAPRVMPRSELQSQYETGVLDVCRMVFARGAVPTSRRHRTTRTRTTRASKNAGVARAAVRRAVNRGGAARLHKALGR